MIKRLLAILTTLAITNIAFAGSFTVVPEQSKTPVTISFIQVSNSAELTPVDVKNGLYELTIKKVGNDVAYFSDRPNRIVGQMSMHNYLAKWTNGKDSLNVDAPNGVLSGVNFVSKHEKAPINIVMELSKPKYNMFFNTFTYQAHVLKFAAGTQAGQAITVHKATLLIDNACFSC